MDLEVTWSGSLERQALCPSLSGYRGSSALMPVLERKVGEPSAYDTAREREYRRLYMKAHRHAQKTRGQLGLW
jgi:hypothetical protein